MDVSRHKQIHSVIRASYDDFVRLVVGESYDDSVNPKKTPVNQLAVSEEKLPESTRESYKWGFMKFDGMED